MAYVLFATIHGIIIQGTRIYIYRKRLFYIYIYIYIYNLSITQEVNLCMCFDRSGNATSADSRLEMSQSGMPWWRRHAELGPGVAESRH